MLLICRSVAGRRSYCQETLRHLPRIRNHERFTSRLIIYFRQDFYLTSSKHSFFEHACYACNANISMMHEVYASVMQMELETEVARHRTQIARELKLERAALSARMSGMRGH